MSTDSQAEPRFYRLYGVLFRVHPDRPGSIAEYLHEGEWHPIAIRSASIVSTPGAVEVPAAEALRQAASAERGSTP